MDSYIPILSAQNVNTVHPLMNLFGDLSLPLPRYKRKLGLEDCLRLFGESEDLTDAYILYCPNCALLAIEKVSYSNRKKTTNVVLPQFWEVARHCIICMPL